MISVIFGKRKSYCLWLRISDSYVIQFMKDDFEDMMKLFQLVKVLGVSS